MSVWTAEREAELRQLVKAGKTQSQIAVVFGVKKGAISGKVARLGLELCRRQGGQLRADPALPVPDFKRSVKTRPLPERPPQVSDAAVPLISAAPNQCRYPLWPDAETGAPDHMVCGKHGYPWCDEHRQRCFGRGTGQERAAHRGGAV